MTTGFPNVVYVVGDAATLVVDTGLGTANGALVARVAKRLSKGPKLFLTTTHYHPEHAAGVGGFPPETILIRPAVQQQELEKEGEQTMTFFRNSPQFAPSLQGLGPLTASGYNIRVRGKVGLGWRADGAADVLGRRTHCRRRIDFCGARPCPDYRRHRTEQSGAVGSVIGRKLRQLADRAG